MDAGITPEQFELLLPLACQWAARTGTRHLQPRSGTIRRSDRGRPSSWRRRAGARPATLRSRDPHSGESYPSRGRRRNAAYFAFHGRADTTVWHFHTFGLQISPADGRARARTHCPIREAWRFRVFFAPVFIPVSHDWLSGRSDGARGYFTYKAHMWFTRIGLANRWPAR